MKQFHDMPHVMPLFLSPGEGGEFVGWQGRQCAPSPLHTHSQSLLLLALLDIYIKDGLQTYIIDQTFKLIFKFEY